MKVFKILAIVSLLRFSKSGGPDSDGIDHHIDADADPRDLLVMLHNSAAPELSSFKPKILDVFRNFKRSIDKKTIFPTLKRISKVGKQTMNTKNDAENMDWLFIVNSLMNSYNDLKTTEQFRENDRAIKRSSSHGDVDLKSLGESLYWV